MNKTCNKAIVLGNAVKKINNQFKNYLQILDSDGKIVYLTGKLHTPPLPGTIIDVSGDIKNNSPEYTLLSVNQDDITFVSGQQGLLIFEAMKRVLSRLKIAFNEDKLRSAIIQPETHLSLLTEEDVKKFLASSDVKNIHGVMSDHGDFIAQTLVSVMFEGLNTIRYPHLNLSVDDDLPFLKNAYPYDVISGFFPEYMSVSLGQAPHKFSRKKTNIFITDFINYKAIDNFFNLLALHVNNPAILIEWVNNPRRPSTVVGSFLRDEQSSGTEIFYPEDFAPVKKLGINQAELIAAKNSNMYSVDHERYAMLPQGPYQALSRVATMDKLSGERTEFHNPEGLKAAIPTFFDNEQRQALESFIDGAPALLIVGPPGAGKSTLFNEISKLCQSQGEEIIFITPTGKAAARLNQSEDIDNATTIHALFYHDKKIDTNSIRAALDGKAIQMFPSAVDRTLNYLNVVELDKKPSHDSIIRSLHLPESLSNVTVCIDEGSQLTTAALAAVLELSPKRIIIAGDPSQLDPVGSGRPFQDLIQAGRQGLLPPNIVLADLKNDHRATKELAKHTAKVRAGQLPEDEVIVFDSNIIPMDDLTAEISKNEFNLIETSGQNDAMSVLLNVVKKDIDVNQPFYDIILDNETSQSLKSIYIPDLILADELRARRVVIPNVMVTAFTNDEVDHIAEELNTIYRSHKVIKENGSDIPQLASLTSRNLEIGDIIMETKNTRLKLSVTTPNKEISNGDTMNGESYLFVGTNVWLPTLDDATSDFGFTFQNLLKTSGFYNDFMSDLQTNPANAKDPNWHYAWYKKFKSSHFEEAHSICRLALIENVLVDINTILESKDHNIKVEPKYQIMLPKLPKKSGSTVQNDDGGKGIIKYWRATSLSQEIDLQDRQTYVKIANETSGIFDTFKSGNTYTIHKSQGSQCNTAICYVSHPMKDEDDFNHEPGTYTGLTRAKNKGVIITNGVKVSQINEIWNKARVKKSQKQSPLMMILKGEIAPLGQTHQITTSQLDFGDKLVIDIDKNDYNSRVGLMKQALNGQHNHVSNIPFKKRSKNILQRLLSENLPDRKVSGDTILISTDYNDEFDLVF